MNVEMLIGMICGVAVGLILIGIMLKVTKTDGSMKCKFDERQQMIRGRGFKYAFFTLLIYDVVYGCIDAVMEKQWVDHLTGMFMGICLGVLVYVVYCIWNEGYFSLNQNPKRVLIAFALIAVWNLAIAAKNILRGAMIEGGKLTFASLNLVCGIMILIIFVVTLIKWQISKREIE